MRRTTGSGLAQLGLLVERRLLHVRRAPARTLGLIMNPLVSMFMVGIAFRGALQLPSGASYFDYAFPGVACQVGLSAIGPSAISLAMEREEGFVDRFRTMGVRMWTVPLAHVLADLLAGSIALTLISGVALALGWRPTASWGQMAAGYGLVLLFAFAMGWGAVAMGVLLSRPDSISALSPFLVIIVPFLSTAFIDPGTAPAAISSVIQANPFSWVVAGVRQLWRSPETSAMSQDSPVAVAIVVCLALAAALAALVTARFQEDRP